MDANSPTPGFTPDIAGTYTIELTISNSNDEESKDAVNIIVIEPNLVFISEDITENRTLTNRVAEPGVPDYCVNADIGVSANLTIEPGVMIVFTENTSLLVENNGVLIADGTAQDQIVFTAKNAGEKWKGLAFLSSDDDRNSLNFVTISEGGSDEISIIDSKATLAIGSFTEVNINNTIIENSANVGLFLDTSSEFLSFENNIVQNNSAQAVLMPADQIRMLDLTSDFSQGNGQNVVEIYDGDVDFEDETSIWLPLQGDIPYIIDTDLDINSDVEIAAGARFLFGSDNYLLVSSGQASLAVNGIAENPVIFTAIDNTDPWRGIAFVGSDDARNLIDHAEISYAGLDFISISDFKAGLTVDAFSTLQISNTTIRNSVENGMYMDTSSELIAFENNTFENNNGYPLIIGADQLSMLDPASQYGLANQKNEISVLGESIDLDSDVTWPALADDTPYVITSDINISSGVSIASGARFLFKSDVELIIENSGFLTAKGTSNSDRVVFTAYDQNLPWRGIAFLSDDVRNELTFAEVSYAGSDFLSIASQKANIYVNAFEELKINNCFINNSVGYGIFGDESATINDGSNAQQIEAVNSFSDNELGNIRIDL